MELWLREKEGEKWRKKKEREETGISFTAGCVSPALFHTLHSWLSPCHYCNPPASSWRSVTKTSFVLAIIALTSSQLWSCMNVSAGREKNETGTQRGLDDDEVPEEAFPDQRVWPCDARSHTVCVRVYVWCRGCDRLNGVLLYSYSCE